MNILALTLLGLLSQPETVRSAIEAAGYLLRWASALALSIRRNQVLIDDAIRLLNGAAIVGLGIVLYCAMGAWPDHTAAGKLVFAAAIATGVYILMGTRGTVELLRERKQWITARRMIGS